MYESRYPLCAVCIFIHTVTCGEYTIRSNFFVSFEEKQSMCRAHLLVFSSLLPWNSSVYRIRIPHSCPCDTAYRLTLYSGLWFSLMVCCNNKTILDWIFMINGMSFGLCFESKGKFWGFFLCFNLWSFAYVSFKWIDNFFRIFCKVSFKGHAYAFKYLL